MATDLRATAKKLYVASGNSTKTPEYITALNEINKLAKGLDLGTKTWKKNASKNEKLFNQINQKTKKGNTVFRVIELNRLAQEVLKADFSPVSKDKAQEASRAVVHTHARTGPTSKDTLNEIKAAMGHWHTFSAECGEREVVADELAKYCLALSKSLSGHHKAANLCNRYYKAIVSIGEQWKALKQPTQIFFSSIGQYEKDLAALPGRLSSIAASATPLAHQCKTDKKEADAVLKALRARRIDKTVENTAR